MDGSYGMLNSYQYFWQQQTRMPCQAPPWGQFHAVDVNTGQIKWSVPLGITESLPAGQQNTGRVGLGNPMVTAGGLAFVGAADDRRLRAFDSKHRQGSVDGEAGGPASTAVRSPGAVSERRASYITAVAAGGANGAAHQRCKWLPSRYPGNSARLE